MLSIQNPQRDPYNQRSPIYTSSRGLFGSTGGHTLASCTGPACWICFWPHPCLCPDCTQTFSVLFPLVLAYAVFATPLARRNTRRYTVYNKCPTSIDLYIGGVKDSTIPTNGNVVKILSIGAGFFYTNANGGSPKSICHPKVLVNSNNKIWCNIDKAGFGSFGNSAR